MKKTLFLVAALCTAVAQAATYTFEYTAQYGGDYPLLEDSTFNVVGADTVATLNTVLPSGYARENSGALIKEGEGTLKAQLNIAAGTNTYAGSVYVNQGTLELLPTSTDTYIGAGNGSSITVNKGAHLIFGNHTGVNIPEGNTNAGTSKETVNLHSVSGGEPSAYNNGVSAMSNVVMQQNSIAAQDTTGGARGEVYAFSTALTNATAGSGVSVANTDLKSNSIAVSGHAVIDNSTVVACDTLTMATLLGSVDDSFTVKNGSKVIYDNETNAGTSNYRWAVLQNTEVDKTSYINAGDKNGTLTADMIGMTTDEVATHYVQLKKDNKLHVAATDQGGVAVRDIRGDVDAFQELEVVYITDQLSGCYLTDKSGLVVTLDETMPWDPTAYDSFTFTVVLKGLDASNVVAVQDDFEILENSPVKLLVDDFAKRGITMDTEIGIRTFLNYGDNQGPATVFRFHLENVVPEPATATLSLLALAGLAARRRRH